MFVEDDGTAVYDLLMIFPSLTPRQQGSRAILCSKPAHTVHRNVMAQSFLFQAQA